MLAGSDKARILAGAVAGSRRLGLCPPVKGPILSSAVVRKHDAGESCGWSRSCVCCAEN